MTEILSIFFMLLVLLALSTFPLNINSQKFSNSLGLNSIFDLLTSNLLLNIFFLFLISFTIIDYNKFFIFILLASIITNFFYFFSKKKYLKFFSNKEFIFFILINFIIFFSIARNSTLTWDGIENWYFKAQIFFYNYNFFDLKEVRGFNYYPHLGSFLWGFFWKNSLLQYEYFGRLIYIYIFLLSIFSISNLLDKKNFIRSIYCFLLILLCYDNFLIGGYQEILLFSFLIFLSKNIYLYVVNERRFNLILCFFILNFIPWIKNEGYLFLIIFTLSLSFLIKYFKNKKDILTFIILSWTFLIIKNLIFYKYLSLNLIHSANIPSEYHFYDIINLVILVLKGLLVAIFKYKIWLFIISAFVFFNINNLSTKKKIFFNFLIVNLIFYFFTIFVIYFSVINDPRGLSWWIDNSVDRIIYSISGFFIISIILILNSKKLYTLK